MEIKLTDEELFKPIDIKIEEDEALDTPKYSYWKSVFKSFFKKKINIICLILLLIIMLFAFVYPMFSNYDKYINQSDFSAYSLTPIEAINKFGFNIKWLLGTGDKGYSIFDRIWESAKTSLSLSFLCALINLSVGIFIGALWGFSRRIDLLMTQVYNVISNVPYILFISVFVLIVGTGFWAFVAALTITGWLGIAYFVRTQVMIIHNREYNLASMCLGTPIIRIITKNVLPFLTSIIVTLAAAEIPAYISYEAFLSYIGIGIDAESLGVMIKETEGVISLASRAHEFWSPVFMAGVITIVLYLVGQNLGDASDPKTHI